jgi:hypothetical protein
MFCLFALQTQACTAIARDAQITNANGQTPKKSGKLKPSILAQLVPPPSAIGISLEFDVWRLKFLDGFYSTCKI